MYNQTINGNSKKGVFFLRNKDDVADALAYARMYASDDELLIEKFISGREISVETLSFESTHYIIQITDKENSGPPHFVELSHHQPAQLANPVLLKINRVVPEILNKVGIANGAAHVEMKYINENLYLIEVNPRGGGDEISNSLVKLSTGFDYVKGMIEVSVGINPSPTICRMAYSGIYYLCQQTSYSRDLFQSDVLPEWVVKKEITSCDNLSVASGNYDRNGYIVYKSDQKIIL